MRSRPTRRSREDPMFALWYQRLGELDARAQATSSSSMKLAAARSARTRAPRKSFGVGIDLISGARAVRDRRHAGRAARCSSRASRSTSRSAGLDAGIVIAPLRVALEPVPRRSAATCRSKSSASISAAAARHDRSTTRCRCSATNEMYGLHARVEVGAQFVSALRLHDRARARDARVQGQTRARPRSNCWPIFHFGWLW